VPEPAAPRLAVWQTEIVLTVAQAFRLATGSEPVKTPVRKTTRSEATAAKEPELAVALPVGQAVAVLRALEQPAPWALAASELAQPVTWEPAASGLAADAETVPDPASEVLAPAAPVLAASGLVAPVEAVSVATAEPVAPVSLEVRVVPAAPVSAAALAARVETAVLEAAALGAPADSA